MPKKIQNTTKAHLISVALPNHAATYTVISHQFVIDYAYQALANAGFGIVDEEYRCTADGQIAQGIYKLNFNNDPELSMMFAWTNSYNKQVKFKCVVGAYINKTGAVMISGEVGSWVRKHTGTADTETKATIDDYITNANMYYNQLVSDKAAMEQVILNQRKQAQLLGVLFGEYEILTTEQASSVRDQMKKPYHVFANSDSLWAFYNYVTNALQFSHPKTWMEDQRMLHYFIGTICDFSTPAPVISTSVEEEEIVDPLASNYGEPENQTNLLVQIAEITKDDSVLWGAQHKITENHAFSMAQLAGVKAPEDIVIHIESDEEYAQRVAEIEGEPEMTELPDNQAVQNGSDFDIDLHQSDEIILDTHELVQYTDPAGNTFELPMLKESEVAPERVKFAIDLAEEGEDIVSVDTINLDEDTEITVEVVENNDLDFNLDFNETETDVDNTADFF